jgi:predicted nucleotidyltransferase
MNLDDLKKSSMLITIAGSHSYGMNTAQSDIDYRGCYSLAFRDYFSITNYNDTITWKDKESNQEASLYEIKKFFKLASECNPNIIECMFCREDDIIHINGQGKLLRDNRELFLSQKAHHSFVGYARSQLKRIKTHKSWLDSPREDMPKRSDFGLPEYRPVSTDQLNAATAIVETYIEEITPWLKTSLDNSTQEAFYESIFNIVNHVYDFNQNNIYFDSWLDMKDFVFDTCAKINGYDHNFIALLKAEKNYLHALNEYKQYQNWKKNRNPGRSELESKFGYDTKHAAHLVRLLRMGEEILTTGEVNVYRKDSNDLLAIRNGKMSCEEIINYADEKTKELYDIIKNGKSVLPERPDVHALNELLFKIITYYYLD